MKRLLRPAVLAAMTALLVSLPFQARAQQGEGRRGNFDPEQMRQRMMERYKEILEIKSDDEWKVMEPRIAKINDARREVGFGGGMRGMFGAGGPGGRRGGDAGQAENQSERRRSFAPQASAAAQELQKAIDSKASAETIKAKLTAYREERQQKQAKLDTAQEELKKVLTLKQEAAAVLAGLLD